MSRQPEPPTYFTDRCLGSRDVPAALRAAGARVEVHDDHFAHDMKDPDLLREIGARGWVFLTKDKRIRWRPMEKAALTEAGLAAFILTGGDMIGDRIARAFVTARPRMDRIVARFARPFLARVTATGEVKMIAGQRRGAIRRDPDDDRAHGR